MNLDNNSHCFNDNQKTARAFWQAPQLTEMDINFTKGVVTLLFEDQTGIAS